MTLIKKITAMSSLLLIASSVTFASIEGGVGNGGISVVCRDQAGQIKTARLLDTWEPETFETINTSELSQKAQFRKIIKKISAFDLISANKIIEKVNEQNQIVIFTKKGLPLTNDALPDYVSNDSGCKFEQLARLGYVNETASNMLRINQEIFDKLSESDKAALFFHEALYQIDREFFGAVDSRKSRHIVATLFSDKPLSTKAKTDIVTLVDSKRSNELNGDVAKYSSHLFISGLSKTIELTGTYGPRYKSEKIQFLDPRFKLAYKIIKNNAVLFDDKIVVSGGGFLGKQGADVALKGTLFEIRANDLIELEIDEGYGLLNGGFEIKDNDESLLQFIPSDKTYRVVNVN